MIYKKRVGYNNKKLKCKKIFVILTIFMCFLSSLNFSTAIIYDNLPVSELKDEFPDSYKPYIESLKKAHPSWVFKAVYTNLDWNLVLEHESYDVDPAISLININDYGDNWLYQGDNKAHDGPYYTASKSAVAYMLDPRNFLNANYIFQFETLSFSDDVHSVESVDKILSSTPMGSSEYKNKYKYYGEWKTMGETYAEMIVRLSKKYNISPTHVASRIRQENSGDIVNGSLINGDEGVYNFFNIGASANPDGTGAVTNGLNTARNNNWTTPELAIEAGIKTLVQKYIQYGQDTIYFQKFDVNNPYGNASWLFHSQYMQNIAAPSNESLIMYRGYVNNNMLDSNFEFHIPVYNNMPNIASPSPDSNDGRFEPDNTRVYLDDPSDSGVNDIFPIRTSPSTSGSLIEEVIETKDGQENRREFTRIGKGISIPWTKLRYPDGREGYVLSKWVYEYKYADVTGVELDKQTVKLKVGESTTITATVSPVNAISKEVSYTSSNQEIATVDNNGKITAKGIGKTDITVTTKNNSKTAKCSVEVISTNVEKITTDKSEYTVILGEYITITPKVLPETATNKKYNVTIQDKSILEQKDRKFYGKSEGNTFVTFTTEEGNKSVKVQVNVIKINDDDILIDESLKIDSSTNYMTKIQPETKVETLKEKIKTKLEVKFLSSENKQLSNTDFITTGSKIQIIKSGKVIKEYTVLIYGDVNPDGKITSKDYMMVKNHIMNAGTLKGVYNASANVNRDETISSKDYMIIKNHIMNLGKIEQ